MSSPDPIGPGRFEAANHFYPEVLGKSLHPLIKNFFAMTGHDLIREYLRLHPGADRGVLKLILMHRPGALFWAGCDLFKVMDVSGHKRIVVLETNSCPSGQKSMPSSNPADHAYSYRRHLENTLGPFLNPTTKHDGHLAVLYDKNRKECSGYAATLADMTNETVYLVFDPDGQDHSRVRFENDVLEIRHGPSWLPIRLALRYVTARPWNRIPMYSKTRIINPVLGCLAGGRNKHLAAQAYEIFNIDHGGAGLELHTPTTHVNVRHRDVPDVVRECGGLAVIKDPYSNAGQGVFTVTGQSELEAFMQRDFLYDRFVVQRLIGHQKWRQRPHRQDYFHFGMLPDKKGDVYVADLRFVICHTPEGYRPQALYGRRARKPLKQHPDAMRSSWDSLGTNLSIRKPDGSWDTETERLVVFDERGFVKMGWSFEDLVEGFFQTLFAVVAIDHLARGLVDPDGMFREHQFHEMNRDDVLLREIML